MSTTSLVKQVDRRPLLDAALREECRRWIAFHSKSFYLASRILPRWVREASWALYAFCRRADDSVDDEKVAAEAQRRVDGLRARLVNVYRGAPGDHPIDRAFALVAERYAIPAVLPEELLAGMEMDAQGARYATFAELDVYCYRVASVVGLMMTCVMGPSADRAWLRAADLGLAMQLTNIARDVGEDARRGRVYLPDELLRTHGVDRDALLQATGPTMSDGLGRVVAALLERAEQHYRSAERGIPLLPASCRPAIYASRLIYGEIGAQVARNGFDSVSQRAVVSTGRKLWLAVRSLGGIWLAPSGDAASPAAATLTPLLQKAGLPA